MIIFIIRNKRFCNRITIHIYMFGSKIRIKFKFIFMKYLTYTIIYIYFLINTFLNLTSLFIFKSI